VKVNRWGNGASRAVLAVLVSFALAGSVAAHGHPPRPVRHYLGGWTRVTQYTQCCVTASGARVFYGEVAAPYWIPLYAQVVIPGLGRFVVLDRGAFNDNHLDVYVPWYPFAGVRDWYQGVYWVAGGS
jgi:hypothetical protein